MEDPSIPQEEFSRALDELETINRLLGGHSTSLSGVAALLPPGVRRFSLLDIGTGGGDFPRRLVAWARDRGIVAEVKGIDLLPAAIEHARRRSGGFPEIGFAREGLLALQGEEEFDIVHAALLLHHLDDAGAREALRRIAGQDGLFHVHLDVDVVDSGEIPAVDFPAPGGISGEDARDLVTGMAASPGFLGIEVTNFNPDRDPGGAAAARVIEIIGAALNASARSA